MSGLHGTEMSCIILKMHINTFFLSKSLKKDVFFSVVESESCNIALTEFRKLLFEFVDPLSEELILSGRINLGRVVEFMLYNINLTCK